MHPFPVRQGLHLNFFEFWFSSVILWPDLQLKFPTFKNPRFQNEQRENEFYFCMGIKNHFHINGFSSRKKKKRLGAVAEAICLLYQKLSLLQLFRTD